MNNAFCCCCCLNIDSNTNVIHRLFLDLHIIVLKSRIGRCGTFTIGDIEYDISEQAVGR